MKEHPYMEELDRFAAYVQPSYVRTDLPGMHLYSRSPSESPPWHTTLAQSPLCYNLPEMYRALLYKKPHANTLTVQAWGLMLSRLNRGLVTNPDRQLPCHFSKTILRTPSYYAAGFFYVSVINNAAGQRSVFQAPAAWQRLPLWRQRDPSSDSFRILPPKHRGSRPRTRPSR